MDARILTCAQCGQRNRIRVTTAKKGIWTCRTCGTALPVEDPAAAGRKRYRAFLIAALALLLPIAAYAAVWIMETSRSRAFAAAAADEFNQGNFDRAAVLALSGLPKPGSVFDVLRPRDAEAQLRRTGIHQLKDERVIPKANDASAWVVKERFLVRREDTALIFTDMTDGQERMRSIAAACTGVQPHGGDGGDCKLSDLDSDDEGRRLLLALGDGSVWLVEADDGGKILVASTCQRSAGDVPCAASRVHLSPTGRHAVFSSRPNVFTAIDLSTGAESILNFARDCDAEKTPEVKTLCQAYPVRVLMFRGDDVLLSRHGSRATMWLLSENGIARDLPIPLDRAMSGPDNSLMGYSVSGDTVAQIVSARGEPLALGLTVKVGNCEAPGQTPERALDCRISSIAMSPRSPDLAIAITGGDIILQRLLADDNVPAQRTLKVDCLALKADAFALFNMDRPSRCSMTALRFAPNGSALAALGNDRVLRVFRVDKAAERRGDGALLASITLDASVTYFGFDASDETLIVALDSGAIRRFDLVAPSPDALLATAGRTEPKPRGLGALRGAICASLGDRTSLSQLSDADLDELRTRYPGLKLSATDRTPCAKL